MLVFPGPIAQRIERQTSNLLVIGSNPIGVANDRRSGKASPGHTAEVTQQPGTYSPAMEGGELLKGRARGCRIFAGLAKWSNAVGCKPTP